MPSRTASLVLGGYNAEYSCSGLGPLQAFELVTRVKAIVFGRCRSGVGRDLSDPVVLTKRILLAASVQ